MTISKKIKMIPHVFIFYYQERILLANADKIFCISKNDVNYYASFIKKTKLNYLPFFFEHDNHKNDVKSDVNLPKKFICIVGNMNSSQNYSAVVTTLESLWPLISAEIEDVSLLIIGKKPMMNSWNKKLIKLSENLSRVAFTDEIREIAPYVKAAKVNIAPINIGSGVRTKIIESIYLKTPVVSTSCGAEGLPFIHGEEIMISDCYNEFSDHVINILNSKKIAMNISEKAFKKYEKIFSINAGINFFNKIND